MATPTSSSDRSKRTAKRRPTSSATRPQRSKASTNSSRTTGGKPSAPGTARVTTGRGAAPKPKPPALPPGRPGGALTQNNQRGGGIRQRGGALAPSPQGQRGGSTTPPKPSPSGPRPGGRVVVDESPRLPQGQRGGALAPRPQGQRGGAIVSRRPGGGGSSATPPSKPWSAPGIPAKPDFGKATVPPKTSSTVPTRQLSPGKPAASAAKPPASAPGPSQAALTPVANGGALARIPKNSKLFNRLSGAALVGGILQAGVESSGTPWGDRAKASREAGDRTRNETGFRALGMLGKSPSRPSRGGNSDPYGASGSKPQMADIRGTGRPVPPDPRNKPKPPAPQPASPSRPSGGGGSGGGGGGRVSSSSSSSSKPASSASAPTSSTPAKPVDSSTDSWSINFLRSKRGLPSLSKAAAAKTPSTDATTGPLSGNFGKDVGYERRLSIPSSGENGYGSAKMTDRKFDPSADLLKKKKNNK